MSLGRKGIIGIGPALLFVNLFSLLASAAMVIGTLGLVSGIVFNKRLREQSLASLLPRIIVFVTLTITIILAVHLVGGPTSNHYIGMLWGALAFAAITSLLSINSIRQDAKDALLTIGVLTLLFLLVAQTSVWLAVR